MSDFISGIAPDIRAMLDYREALGYKRASHEARLVSLDRFCASNYPDATVLSQDIVMNWLGEQCSGIGEKASAARLLGRYMKAIGKNAYVLYQSYMKKRSRKEAYLFTDDELSALFRAIDTIVATNKEPFLPEVAPVLYRLIYTCGLRPNEGRGLKRSQVNLKTGEILITETKWKKERMVVMSGDMLALCRTYEKRWNIIARGNEYFFPSWKSGGPFGSYQLDNYFKSAWNRAHPKVDKTTLPSVRVYDLRHRFASAVLIRWLDSNQPLGAKLTYLRAYMGHNSLSETAYYIHLLPENLVRSAGLDWAAFDEMAP
ncbi:MAG: tyrosine-type recombinase/integrase, partial [Christensenellaceae bacterium]